MQQECFTMEAQQIRAGVTPLNKILCESSLVGLLSAGGSYSMIWRVFAYLVLMWTRVVFHVLT